MEEEEEERVNAQHMVRTCASHNAETDGLGKGLQQTWPRHHGGTKTPPPGEQGTLYMYSGWKIFPIGLFKEHPGFTVVQWS